MKQLTVVVVLMLSLFASDAYGQHEHHMKKEEKLPAGKVKSPSETPHSHGTTTQIAMPESDTDTSDNTGDDTTTEMHMDHEGSMANMSHSLSLHLPMNRNGSGTSWNPDASPMYMAMLRSKRWTYMFHGNVFIRYNKQDITHQGVRGDEQWDAPNMMMAMGQRQIGKNGLFHVNTMFSLDALITGQTGYPLLFQSGESAHGVPLVDRQHPHDLFAELSVSYSHSFSKSSEGYVYLGYPGEPALGATTFMHRASGMDNPDAPLSHHWVDATHISFGVATLGYRLGSFKIEASSFTGREPNENRYDFDKPRFDSRSARLWFNPNQSWSLQVSHGFIKSPEALHADEDIYRTTASASYSKKLGRETFFNATGLWGMNKVRDHSGEHAALLEAALRVNRLVAYGRYEWVQKSAEELNLDEAQYGHGTIFPVNALTVGAGYDVLRLKHVRTALGTQLSIFPSDEKLHPLYGKAPLAWEAYLRFYPSLMKHKVQNNSPISQLAD